ncbi:MAG TPA: tetratricopeptide repeat protein, partial [Chloroflexi bacterium]|nr:tetratricopeptide repeat protein [Chloroflexota bacterium]
MASDDVQRAVALIRSGQRAEARELLKDILIRDRNNAAAWAAMVQVAESRKEAIICLKQVLRLKPGDPWATRALAQLEGRAPPPPPPATPSPPPARTSPPPASPPSQPDSWREPVSGAGLPPTEPFPSASAFPPSSRASVRRPEPAPSGREGWRESPAGRTAPRAAAPPEEEDIEAWRRPLVREGDEQTGSEQERPRQSSSMLLIVGGIIILLIALCAIGIGFLMLSSGGPSRFTLPGGFVLPGSGVGGAPYDGGDELETTLVRSIRPGQ